ncbi:DUF2938 domain-containing protein [Halocynthiibacter styelae]|uniref:DUF2938 domain-containing protein n=1 Tax=Halocynthiibacter styelae TaxID=2761955 RepID=A0A8J7LVN5_9RHOB|nr:DUF2938 domain-containing protein [Paenihalocynthiibacter styelae]MBI1493312.1 DUF2938 domain-containing protein [Paenihalocynthiibacter styelae]
MESYISFFQYALIGIGATLIMDLWALTLRRAFGVPSLDFALVGRWLLQMRHGIWFHRPITGAPYQQGERPLGWLLHYAIGVIFAITFGIYAGTTWITQPTPAPVIIFGLLTVGFPFLIMQPAFGAGIAAARTPCPGKARVKSLMTHLVFGVGLWLSAMALAQF